VSDVYGVSDLLPLLEAIGLLHTGVVLAQTHPMHGGPQGAQQLDTHRDRDTQADSENEGDRNT
jgi:hypothetical protein